MNRRIEANHALDQQRRDEKGIGRVEIKGFASSQKSTGRRTAEFLDAAAKEFPETIVRYDEIARAIFGVRPTPELIKTVKNSLATARKALLDRGRSTVSLAGVGIRATANSKDVVCNAVPAAKTRYESALRSLQDCEKVINVGALARETARDPREVAEDIMRSVDSLKEVIGSARRALAAANK